MTAPVTVYKTALSSILVGGQAQTIMYGPVLGGVIVNPASADDQGLAVMEPLFVDVVGAAGTEVSETTFALQPGQSYWLTPNQASNVSVNAASSGHKFSAIVFQPKTPYPPAPQPGNFPPAGPTSVVDVIPSYLYVEYNDDADLQAFVDAYNKMAQEYVDWFNDANLPIYTGLSGQMLDWVAEGLYGMKRPALPSGLNLDKGPFNTYEFNTLAYNARKSIGAQNVTVTSDDVFKRIITWNFYKGDGNTMTVRWLKRRIMRFLIGAGGSAPNIDQTYKISVTFGAPNIVSIRISIGTRRITGGALFNRFAYNTMAYNALQTVFTPAPDHLPNETIFKEAMAAGALQLPFQYVFDVHV